MNILYILQFFLISQLVEGWRFSQADSEQISLKNAFTLSVDQKINQVFSMCWSFSNNSIYLKMLAEMRDQSLVIFKLKINNTLVNNEIQPDFQIYEEQQINQILSKELLLSYYLSFYEPILIYIHEKKILFHNVSSSENFMSFQLNYSDPINTIEAQFNGDQFLVVYINILLSNWSVQIFDQENSNDSQSPYIIQYDSNDIEGQRLFRIKQVVCSRSVSYLLSEDGVIYKFENLEIPEIFQQERKNEQFLDICLINWKLGILIRVNNTCSVEQITQKQLFIDSFNCYSNDQQLVVPNNFNNALVIQNHTSILQLSDNKTFPLDQESFMLIPNFKMLITYGNTSFISIQFLETSEKQDITEYKIHDIQSEIQSYELDQSYLNSNQELFFKSDDQRQLQLAPYNFGPPFSVKVIKDEYSLIYRIDQPIYHETCLQSTESYQFFKFITKYFYIYQENKNDVYLVQCKNQQAIMNQFLRSNQQVIIYFSARRDYNYLSIYFDDRNGQEFYSYNINLYRLEIENNLNITFTSPINRIQKHSNQLIIQHIDLSQTIFDEHATKLEFQYNQSHLLKIYEFVGRLSEYLLCTQNNLSDKIGTLLVFDFISFYMINRYHIYNSTIVDLIVLEENQFILILKSQINELNYLNHYYLADGKITLLRELPNYKMSPQRFLDGFKLKFMISALNTLGDSYVLIYDFSKNSSECLLRFIPYPKEQFWLSNKSIYVLENWEENNNITYRMIQQYLFNGYFIQINEIYQKQYAQNYNITLQIDNLISQDQVILQLIGYDQTEQLIVQRQVVPIQQINQFQKVNFNEYIYGPINTVTCKQNCILNTFISMKTIYSFKFHGIIKYALVMGNELFMIQSRSKNKIQILTIKNRTITKIEELQLETQFWHLIGIQKLVNPKLPMNELIAIIDFYSQAKANTVSIKIYEYKSQFNEVCQLQFESRGNLQTIKIQNNIILIREIDQLTLYQYKFEINQFGSIIIHYQHNEEIPIDQDHQLHNNQLFCAIFTEQMILKIIVIDLTLQSVKFENQYLLETQINLSTYHSIKILTIKDDSITLLYFKDISPSILHIQRDEQGLQKLNIQKLIIQFYHIIQVSMVYYDEKKIIFKILKIFDEEYHEKYLSLLFLINWQENYTFPSQSLDPINQILPIGSGQLLFLNNTDIGFIKLFDSYVIKISAPNFQIEVSNFQQTINVDMSAIYESNTQENEFKAKITLIFSTIGLLFLIFWFCLRRNRMKYQNLK